MKTLVAALLLAIILPANTRAEEIFINRLQGDLGGFVNVTSNTIRGVSNSPALLPYAYFDYGRVFTRIDTFGIKTLPVGYGYLELAGRVKLDGYRTDRNDALIGINDRENPIPVGIGSFQLTPIGGFFLYALYDANKSHGSLVEINYATEFSLSRLTVYPQLTVERLSGKYTQYFYGVSGSETVTSGLATYHPPASTNPSFNVMFEIPLNDGWLANVYLRRKWLGSAIANSPLIIKKTEDNIFLSLAFRFK